jgi:hypothetical protein
MNSIAKVWAATGRSELIHLDKILLQRDGRLRCEIVRSYKKRGDNHWPLLWRGTPPPYDTATLAG